MANLPDNNWLYRYNIGAGGFGVVQLWQNENTMEMIAIKCCKGDGKQLSAKQKERWIHEVETMNSLCHPNIVGTRTVPAQLCDLQDPLPVLCMEYCSLGDLRKFLNKTSNCCGIEEKEALKIMRHVASAVEYLHSHNFTHRDLKPENIVIQRSTRQITYKLTDFGYICELSDATIDRSVVGTLNYLAPELLYKIGYKRSVDYWSLGILFYEIITGNRPFLPDMNVAPKWMEHMKKKEDKHICAREEDGTVIFGEEIESPTTVSDCMRDKLKDWFTVVLQWDPKKRGKIRDDQGHEKLVVFSLLKTLLSFKILYVFIVPLYRLDSYAVDPQIRVQELQNLIRDKTGIDVSHHIISDPRCNVLKDPASFLLDCTKDSHLYVYRIDGPYINEIPPPNKSRMVQRMITDPKKPLKHETLKRYYRAVVFFVNQELNLFRSYVLALSINIDLNNSALEKLHETVKFLRTNASDLMTDLTILKQPSEYERMSQNLKELVNTTMSKIQTLFDNTEKVTANINALTKEFADLKKFSEISWLEKWTLEYEKATRLLELITSVRYMRDSPSHDMAKLLYGVLKLRVEQLRCPQIETTVRRIKEFDKNISQLQTALNSFQGLLDHYRKNYEEISIAHTVEEQNWYSSFLDSMPQCDTVIYDNRVLHHLIESLDGSHPPIEDLENFDW